MVDVQRDLVTNLEADLVWASAVRQFRLLAGDSNSLSSSPTLPPVLDLAKTISSTRESFPSLVGLPCRAADQTSGRRRY